MKFPLDSEYQDVSFEPPFGASGESGRNSIELVLQTRPANIDSDLAWTDMQTLASGILGTPAPPVPPRPPVVSQVGTVTGTIVRPPLPAQNLVVRPGVTAARIPRQGAGLTPQQASTLASAVNLGSAASGAITDTGSIGAVGTMFDPAIWEATVNIPDVGGKPARIVVREYERYYTDRTVPERRGNTTFRRRVVEERLVYTVFFDL
jgi:hypothetical protein